MRTTIDFLESLAAARNFFDPSTIDMFEGVDDVLYFVADFVG
jgi:hypothetical protein